MNVFELRRKRVNDYCDFARSFIHQDQQWSRELPSITPILASNIAISLRDNPIYPADSLSRQGRKRGLNSC